MIFDLLSAIKKAYQEIYSEKIEAKEKIKDIENLAKTWNERSNDIHQVETLLTKNWQFLPIKQRKDYIQRTVDLIHYGFDIEYHKDGTQTYHGGYNYGLTQMYEYLHNICNNYLNSMKTDYKHRDYKNVILNHKECVNEITVYLECKGIVEKK